MCLTMVSLVWRSAARQQPPFWRRGDMGVKAAFVPRASLPRTPNEPLWKDGSNSVCMCVCVSERVWVCVCMLKCDVASGGKYYMGQSGVRPKECAELDQEESTQRTSMHNVNKIGHHCAYGGRVKLSVIHRFTQPRVYFICPVMPWLWKKKRERRISKYQLYFSSSALFFSALQLA